MKLWLWHGWRGDQLVDAGVAKGRDEAEARYIAQMAGGPDVKRIELRLIAQQAVISLFGWQLIEEKPPGGGVGVAVPR